LRSVVVVVIIIVVVGREGQRAVVVTPYGNDGGREILVADDRGGGARVVVASADDRAIRCKVRGWRVGGERGVIGDPLDEHTTIKLRRRLPTRRGNRRTDEIEGGGGRKTMKVM
jgi:hypothetical protein